MNAFTLLRKAVPICHRCGALSGGDRNLSAAQGQNQDEEMEMGQEVFDELKGTGEIVESSPLYDQLRPIADGHYPSGAAAIQPPLQVLSGS